MVHLLPNNMGILVIHVNQYIPYTDLFHIYSKAGLLPDSIKTDADLEKAVKSWAIFQYKQLTALKLLNFVAGNQLYSTSPWTAANLYNGARGNVRRSFCCCPFC